MGFIHYVQHLSGLGHPNKFHIYSPAVKIYLKTTFWGRLNCSRFLLALCFIWLESPFALCSLQILSQSLSMTFILLVFELLANGMAPSLNYKKNKKISIFLANLSCNQKSGVLRVLRVKQPMETLTLKSHTHQMLLTSWHTSFNTGTSIMCYYSLSSFCSLLGC